LVDFEILHELLLASSIEGNLWEIL